jgi:quinol monooxygenase YgiN
LTRSAAYDSQDVAGTSLIEPRFAVIYRWRLKPGKEQQFVQAWSRMTEAYVRNCGALGSRLHRGPDSVWYAYAQWPDAAARERAFARNEESEARGLMDEAIAEKFPAIVLEPVADYLVSPLQG